MKELKLSNSDNVALLDDEDYEVQSKFNWQWCESNIIRCTSKNGIRRNVILAREINKTPAGLDTDHINRNKLDNRKENLRTATRSGNCANRKKFKNGMTSKYKGVCLKKGSRNKPWNAQIQISGKRTSIGLFANEIDAALAYNQAAKKQYGEFALVNPI